MLKQLKFVVEQWVLFMVQWQMARHFQIESGRPIRIRIESRSFVGPYFALWYWRLQYLGLLIEIQWSDPRDKFHTDGHFDLTWHLAGAGSDLKKFKNAEMKIN